MASTTHLIAAKPDFRVRNIVAQYGMNVINYRWVLACVERGFLVDLEPILMVSVNEELKAYFKENLDKFGDHFV